MQAAVKLKADLVIFTSTSSDRLDIPIKKFNKLNAPRSAVMSFVMFIVNKSSKNKTHNILIFAIK